MNTEIEFSSNKKEIEEDDKYLPIEQFEELKNEEIEVEKEISYIEEEEEKERENLQYFSTKESHNNNNEEKISRRRKKLLQYFPGTKSNNIEESVFEIEEIKDKEERNRREKLEKYFSVEPSSKIFSYLPSTTVKKNKKIGRSKFKEMFADNKFIYYQVRKYQIHF